MAQTRPVEEYELLPRSSSDSAQYVQSCSDSASGNEYHPLPISNSKLQAWYFCYRLPLRLAYPIFTKLHHRRHSRQQYRRRLLWALVLLFSIVTILLFFTAVLRPSYTHPPEHYNVLERKCKDSQDSGRGNINNEKVFIAATLYDPGGLLLGGDWGIAVVELVQLLGPSSVHLSVYENDPDERAKGSLERLRERLTCNVSLVSEHLPLEDIPFVTVPSGERRMKRIAFLAEVRNRALRPLHDSPTRFDKLLYINDVMFKPIDAVQLLFSTNINTQGRAQYGAACAVDFINAFKFYDRFATRDLEGHETGIPFFPWFIDAGDSASRQDVLAQKDAVRVRACWGGMTAFEASWFQKHTVVENSVTGHAPNSSVANLQLLPLRFRYELDPFWDASECCLIHADLTYLRQGRNNITKDSGIYTNPYVRVAYDSRTLSWLPYTRRIERVYPFIHNLLNHLVGLPAQNPRRLEQPGDEVIEKVWNYDGDQKIEDMSDRGSKEDGTLLEGSYQDIKRITGPGRFCGRRALVVLREDAKDGEKKWMKIPLPLLPG